MGSRAAEILIGQQSTTRGVTRVTNVLLTEQSRSDRPTNQGQIAPEPPHDPPDTGHLHRHLNKRHRQPHFLRNEFLSRCRVLQNFGLSTVLQTISRSPERLGLPLSLPAGNFLPTLARPLLPVKHSPLPFHRLAPFEQVQGQFADWGVWFEGTIALFPSNPNFFNPSPQLVLMPSARRRSMTITLQQPRPQLTLQVRGYRDIRLSALDRSGHCITHCQTRGSYTPEPHKAPLEILTIAGHRTHHVILESSSPFVLESLSL